MNHFYYHTSFKNQSESEKIRYIQTNYKNSEPIHTLCVESKYKR